MAVLGFDLSDFRRGISQGLQDIRGGAQQAAQAGGDWLGYLAGVGAQHNAALDQPQRAAGNAVLDQPGQALGNPALNSPTYAMGNPALSYGGGQALGNPALATPSYALGNPALNQGGQSLGNPLLDGTLTLPYLHDQPPAQQPATGGGQATGAAATGGGASTGLEPGVAKWADQTKQAFGDLLDPDIMLAIMTNESHGNPAAYNPNAPGGAWGLFQNVGLGSNDPGAQFAAARQLAQEKLAGINQAYAANGLNPDARTRARDFALAWGGHFDYKTGLPNPNSRDAGSGQTAEQLSAIFLANYDAIKAGRQQAPTGGGRGLAALTPGVGGSVMQEFGPTEYASQHPGTYAYGNAYGLQGSQHPGVDWAVPRGTRVATPLGGTVTVTGNDHGTGYYYTDAQNGPREGSGEFQVTLDNGDQLILGHLSQITAQLGQRVNAGDLIGTSGGSDGAHIHVEYRQRQPDGSYRIIDPRTILGS